MNAKKNLVDQKYKLYLYDLGPIIKEYLDKLTRESKKYNKDTLNKSFIDGQLMSFVWFVEMLKQQAQAFNIDIKELRLNDINSENDISKYIS